MLEIAASACWLVAFVGLVMAVGAIISRTMKRLLRLSDETVADPWFRSTDTSGLSLGIHWLRPGLIIMLTAAAAGSLLEILR